MAKDSVQDRWSTWLLQTRFAGDPERKKAFEEYLFPIRERVLANANVAEGNVLLDVGAGDGLIAFGALPLVGASGRVLFSDVSDDLLDHARTLAEQMGVLDRVDFVRVSADDLTGITDASVDVVTTRSVLVYVARKEQAFREFRRVLRPGGRISIFEPINRFGYPWPPGTYLGVDVRPIEHVAAKVRALYERLQPAEADPMLDFDERDLVRHVEAADFREIHLEYRVTIQRRKPMRWDHVFHSSGNPNIPTLQAAVSQALTPFEAELFVDFMRPRIEAGDGTTREAVAYLRACK
jgi:ubiquinone/menaquinone biosynthesis C-methylase UbiE